MLTVVAVCWRPRRKNLKQPAANELKLCPITNAVEVATDAAGDSGNKLGPVETKQAAILFLRVWLFPADVTKIRALIEKHGAQEWVWHLHDDKMAELLPHEQKVAVLLGPHFGFGMQVRNALRRAGFGEQKLGVSSLGEIYVALLEAAVQESPSPDCGCTGKELTSCAKSSGDNGTWQLTK